MAQRRTTALRPEHMSSDQRALYDTMTNGPRTQGPQHFPLTDADGRLNGPFADFLLSPPVGEALQEVGSALRYRTGLTDRAREVAILLVAARQDSAFERNSHEAIARALGMTASELEGLRAERTTGLPEDEQLVGRTVLALLDGDLDEETWRLARDHLGERTIFELTTLVGYYSTLALQMRVFRVDSAMG